LWRRPGNATVTTDGLAQSHCLSIFEILHRFGLVTPATEWGALIQIRESIAHRIEADARKALLPLAPDKYEVRPPTDFPAPEGVRFEFNMNDPAHRKAREVAHKRGVDRGNCQRHARVFAATKIAEQQRTAQLIQANRERLGAADNRIGQIETWLRARVGAKADPMMALLPAYPVVERSSPGRHHPAVFQPGRRRLFAERPQ
jgi:hypothetical protein